MAAARATVRRLEFHIIYRCVNSCIFCSERDHMRAFARHPAGKEELVAILRSKRAEGFDHVTFTGGEPTLYPRFWEVLERAKELGYRTYVISNGSALALRPFARRVLPLVDEICLSIHGHEAALHDRLTTRPGSFQRQQAALDNIQEHPAEHFVMVNTVVNRFNLDHLEDILAWAVQRRKVRHYLVSNLAPEGEALRRYGELAVRHGEICGRVPALSALAERYGVALRVFGVPACLLGPYRQHSNDLHWSPRMTIARAWVAGPAAGWFEETALKPTRERMHPDACSGCQLREQCGGVFRRYWQEFGPEQLHPIRLT